MKVLATFEVQNNDKLTEEEMEQKICEALESLNTDGLKAVAWEYDKT